MAIEESEVAAAAVRADPAAGLPSDPLPRLKLDDLRLRLDSPLFARDPGLGASADAQSVRELTWRHAVTPVDHPEEPAGPLPAAIPALPALPALDALRAIDPLPPLDLVSPLSPTPDPSPSEAPSVVGIEQTVAEATVEAAPPTEIETETQIETATESATDERAVDALTSGELALLRARQLHPQRDPDPVMSGLAELIVRSTPANGLQAVRTTGDLPVIPVEAVTVAPAATAGQSTPEPVGAAAVEAELNRLAFLPDVDPADTSGPVEVPAIAVSEVVAQQAAASVPAAPAAATPGAAAVAPAQPALTLAAGEAYVPRASAAPVARRSYADFAPTAYVQPRRRKRHLARRLFTFLVLLAMVAGGLFAVKIYVLDARWSGEMKPFADTVSEARALSFDHAVDVRTLPVEEYAEALGAWSLAIDPAEARAAGGELRALGLLNGELDLRSVGLSAMPTSPAFYDYGNETIVVAAGLPAELRSFALHRALALALLDQEYGWGGRARDASPANRVGILALYDADAMATAIGLLSDADREAVVGQIFGLYGTYSIPSSPAPYATVVGGRLGLAAWPAVDALDDATLQALLTDAAPSDGRVLDIRRLVNGTDVVAGANARGMLFWYHVLAARVDDDLAWQAALTWQGDDVSLLAGGTGTCVAAVFRSAGGTGAAETAFAQWAAAAPTGSSTTVAPSAADSGTQFTINACDPGAAVQTSEGTAVLALGGAPLWSELFRQTRVADPALTADVAACMAAQAGPVSMSDERGVVDPVGGWAAPAAHPVSRGSC